MKVSYGWSRDSVSCSWMEPHLPRYLLHFLAQIDLPLLGQRDTEPISS